MGKNAAKILVIDDERAIRNTVKEVLEFEGYAVDTAEDGKRGLEMAQGGAYDLIYSDVKMPEMDGMEVLAALRSAESGVTCPVVMISGHGDIRTAVDALKAGAWDFIEKPLGLDRLLVTTKNALEHKDLQKEIGDKRQEIRQLRGQVTHRQPD